MIKVKNRGSFMNVERFLQRAKDLRVMEKLERVGQLGVEALAEATPKDTGKTAASWSYEILKEDGRYKIVWNNSNVYRGINIALILQTGHATKNGGWVEGIDYVNPALKGLFDNMAEDLWREVISI